MNSQPHNIRYWLHSMEKGEDPVVFARKVNEICGLYQTAQEQAKQGAHVISTDEMTGIQTLEHKYPDKPPASGNCYKGIFKINN